MPEDGRRTEPAKTQPAPKEPALVFKKKLLLRQTKYGEFQVTEDINKDFLEPQERMLFQAGYTNLKKLLAVSHSGIDKMILTSIRRASCIVGFQPQTSLEQGEAPFICDLLNKAGEEVKNQFAFLSSSDGNNTLVNIPAAEQILKKYQNELRLTLPERSLTRNETIENIMDLIHDHDPQRVHLALGLLSGYPLEDSISFSRSDQAKDHSPIHDATLIENPDLKWPGKNIGELNHLRYSNEGEETFSIISHEDRVRIFGFGLSWLTANPIFQDSKNQMQKIWQVDRELGLMDSLKKVRKSFNHKENVWRIDLVKLINKLLKK